jgi:single-strand DNA-binding protein
MNNVTLVGRLGADPEVNEKFTKISIATNDGFGESKKTNWHNCVCFGKVAEIIGKYAKKGDNISVSGRIEYSQKDDKYYTNIVISNVTLLGEKSSQEAYSGGKSNTQDGPEPASIYGDVNPFNKPAPIDAPVSDDLPF